MKRGIQEWRMEARRALNRWLAPANIRIDSRSAERAEAARIRGLQANGWFDAPAFPANWKTPEALIRDLLDDIARCQAVFDRLASGSAGFSYDNAYFSAPDVEALYAMLRRFPPAVIVEVGSGNSTAIMRRAIQVGGWKTRLISVDPQPREDVSALADEIHRRPVEALPEGAVQAWLRPGGMLFIDSSHAIRPGNDVAVLFLKILPALPAGTLVHVHDVYLPFEYPAEAGILDFNEQYLLQALLGSPDWEVLWPGYQLERQWPGFAERFPHWRPGRHAVSFWMRKRA